MDPFGGDRAQTRSARALQTTPQSAPLEADAPAAGLATSRSLALGNAPPTELAPVLLADASWYGTLAAARDLGRRGVPVTLASDVWFAPARWARAVTRVVRCPPTSDTGRFLSWLAEFGRRERRHVLLATSDDLAWIIADHANELRRWFDLAAPPLPALAEVLDKARLMAHAAAVGLGVPQTRCPADEAEAERLGRELGFPLFLKPRIQALRSGGGAKGARVDRPEQLAPRWSELRRSASFHPDLTSQIPGAELPLLQAAHAASEEIYTVDGWCDPARGQFAALACWKRIQLPRRVGPGLCFEDAPLDPAIAEGLRALCARTGFSGMFDAEFLVCGDRRLLIDFNPRLYNHVAFEVDRGLPLPWLAYLAALGQADALAAEVARAARVGRVEGRIYAHRLRLSLALLGQAISRGMDRSERSALRRWLAEHSGRLTDPAADPRDPGPGWADLLFHLFLFLRHPRNFLRTLLASNAPAQAPDAG